MAMTDECNQGSHDVCSGIFKEEEFAAVSCECGCHAHVFPTGHVPVPLPITEPEGITVVMEEAFSPEVEHMEQAQSDEVPAEVPA